MFSFAIRLRVKDATEGSYAPCMLCGHSFFQRTGFISLGDKTLRGVTQARFEGSFVIQFVRHETRGFYDGVASLATEWI